MKSDFLHPTTKGGQIRTLEMLKRLHQRHEVHYIALDHPRHPEAISRSSEYCTKAYAIRHDVPEKTSPAFAIQLVEGLFSPLPVAVSRYKSAAMQRKIEELNRTEDFDCVVCDFLFPAPNISDLSSCVLFQHNVESIIWKRRLENASNVASRFYYQLQSQRMFAYEMSVCREARNVIAVSEIDAAAMRKLYGASKVSSVPTGVDVDYFAPKPQAPIADLVFLGSMDWMPNIDGIMWFVSEVLPLIWKRKPDCSLVIAGRTPSREVVKLAETDSRIQVTGTIPDVRPYLWGSAVSIVPLRIGGGTRLKIYEAMAAKIPVVSTHIGAEGLDVDDGGNIFIADQPADFAERCLTLLENTRERTRIATFAFELIRSRYSWEVVTQRFEDLLTR